jgi:TIR domain
MHDLFISYSRKDAASVAAVVECLKKRGLAVWFDQSQVFAAHNVVGEIDLALESCSHFLLFASRDYFNSEWATAEYRAALYMALSKRNVSVLVVKLDDSAVPALIAPLQHIPFTTPAEVCATITGFFAPHDAADSSSRRPHSTLWSECSWDSLDDASLYTLLDTLLSNVGALRQQGDTETTFRVKISNQLFFDLTISVPLINDEMLMADLNSEWRIHKVLKKTVNSHNETLRKGGLGIFQPAFEITLDEKLSELNVSRARIHSQLSAIVPVLKRYIVDTALPNNSK